MTNAANSDSVTVAGETIPVEVALTVLRGYCLGSEQANWVKPAEGVGEDLDPLSLGAFAFVTYDEIPAAASPTIEPIDVLVADGLNAKMLARDIAGVLAVAQDLGREIAKLDNLGVEFWTLSSEQISTAPNDEADPAWPLWRAWTILMGVPGIEVARAHKILHHKRPSVFPLIDNQTLKRLGRTAWRTVHGDLTATPAPWEWLERSMSDALSDSRAAAPTRLRLHDILLWTGVTGRRAAAMEIGHSLVDRGVPRSSHG